MTKNTQVLLRRQSDGVPQSSDFETVKSALPEPGDGQLLTETVYLSLDPYLRSKISGKHMSGSVAPGELMAGEAISRVLVSNSDDYSAGDFVYAHSGWQSHNVIDLSDPRVRRVDPGLAPLSVHLSYLGMPGLTAYAAVMRLSEPKQGDIALVSSASGAVGSLIAQLCKLKGCRVVGIAGAAEKCQWVTDVAGMDDCVSYRTGDLREGLDRACPDGIDLYFDGVGGDTLLAAMERLRVGAQLVLFGLMSQYNSNERPPGPNPAFIIGARATVRGLVVYDHEDLRPQMEKDISQWLREDKLKVLEDRTIGLENAAEGFSQLMQGNNVGKAIVVVSDE